MPVLPTMAIIARGWHVRQRAGESRWAVTPPYQRIPSSATQRMVVKMLVPEERHALEYSMSSPTPTQHGRPVSNSSDTLSTKAAAKAAGWASPKKWERKGAIELHLILQPERHTDASGEQRHPFATGTNHRGQVHESHSPLEHVDHRLVLSDRGDAQGFESARGNKLAQVT